DKNKTTAREHFEAEALRDRQWAAGEKESSNLPNKVDKPVRIMGQNDHARIKAAVLEHLHRPGLDRSKAAFNIFKDLTPEQVASLKKTQDGLDTILIANVELLRSSDQAYRALARRLLHSDNVMPPQKISSSQMAQGIGRYSNAEAFLEFLHQEARDNPGQQDKIALTKAKELTTAEIQVLRETSAGLKALAELRERLSGGSYNASDRKEAQKQYNRISEALVPGSVPVDYKTLPRYGSLDRMGPGKMLHDHIQNSLREADRVQTATNIISGISDEGLDAALKDPLGKKAIMACFDALLDGKGQDLKIQLGRVESAIQRWADKARLAGQTGTERVPVFPVRYTYTGDAKPLVRLNDNGDINVHYPTRVWEYGKQPSGSLVGTGQFNNEIKTLPDEVFKPDGVNFKPEQKVGIKVYPDGSTVYVPAAFLLRFGKMTIDDVKQKIGDMVLLGTPQGTIAKGGLAIAEKAANAAAKALWGVASAVNENQEWLISKGESGRKVIDIMDKVKKGSEAYVGIHGAAALVNDLKNVRIDLAKGSSAAERSNMIKIDKAIRRYEQALQRSDNMTRPPTGGPPLEKAPVDRAPGRANIKVRSAEAFADTTPLPGVSAHRVNLLEETFPGCQRGT
ncbi:MAG: hypothetical protein H6Q39_1926, partial [Chloroflexi bacterium]|nr:hypothetical protein [Chloroflexota bacterium]